MSRRPPSFESALARAVRDLLPAVLACLLALPAPAPAAAQAPIAVGEPLPAWSPGVLDIHQISTGRGNAALLVLPDGTSVLVDAGGAGDGIPETDPHPDASRRPGEWTARYVARHLPPGADGLDFVLLTHFHIDHVGGILDVLDALPVGTLVDRGFPDYDYPAPLTGDFFGRYRAALAEARSRGTVVERFRPGAADQLRARRTAGGVEIRNIVGNGVAWTGEGDGTRALFPPLDGLDTDDWPTENMCSLGIRLTWGEFGYFTGGDLPGTPDPGFPDWHALESVIATTVGPVDVHVVNQHGSMGEESIPFLRELASTVHVIPSWAPSHPAPDVLKRIMNSRLPPRPHRVFVTDLRDAARTVIGPRAGRLAGPPGHVVVRVEDGGARYRVAVLSNADESDTVVAVEGPFESVGR